MNLSYFISKKIAASRQDGFSSTIHKIAIASIAIGLAASIVSFLIMKGFQETIKNKMYGFSGHLVMKQATMNNSLEGDPMSVNIDIYKHPEDYPFIGHIQEFAHKPGLIRTENEVVGVFIKGVGRSFDASAFEENMVEGEFLHFPDSSYANETVLSSSIARMIQAKVGDDIIVHFFQNPPRFRRLRIVGIYETNLSEYYDSKIIFGDIRMIQRLNDWPDSIAGGLEVVVNSGAYTPKELLQEEIAIALAEDEITNGNLFERIWIAIKTWWSFDYDLAAMERARDDIRMVNDYTQYLELTAERYLQIFEWLNLISRQVNILLGVILTVICVNMISIVLILVMERTQMIGMLKALGAKDRLIRSVFVYNGVNLILKGLVVGNAIGLGLCYLQYKFKFIKLNPRDYYMSEVPISWHWDIVIVLNVLMLIIVTLVLLIPTMVISRINPIRAIRFD